MNIELNKPQHVTSLATSGLLVAVEVNVWSATKQDRAISNEVTTAKKADSNAGRFVKNLLANNADHKNMLNYRQTIYNWMVRKTYPWNKAQDYLPHVSLPSFMQEFHNHKAEFERLLDVFCTNYSTTVSNMAFAQGDMFNRNDYPDVSEVRKKFGVHLYTSEIPVGDYRCSIAQDLADDLNNHYNQQAQSIVEGIINDQVKRLTEVMESLAHCCGYDETTTTDGETKQKKRKIYEGTVEKAKEYCRVYKDFNLTNDQMLDSAITQLDLALRGVDADTLRDSDAVRSQVKDEVDDILSMFAPRSTN
jgi:hypothetical protein